MEIRKQRHQKGSTLFFAIIITTLILTIGLSIAQIIVTELKMSKDFSDSQVAYFNAQKGVEAALLKLKECPNYIGQVCYPITPLYEYCYDVQNDSGKKKIVAKGSNLGIFNSISINILSNSPVWAKTYGGDANEFLLTNSIDDTVDEGYILGIISSSFGVGGNDFLIIKTNNGGDIDWAKTYGGVGADNPLYVEQTGDSYVLGGSTASYGAGAYDYFFIETDTSGNVNWAKTYGGTGSDELKIIKKVSDGYVLGGHGTSYGTGGYDFSVIKTDFNGNMLWTKTYGGGDWELFESMQQTSDGGFILGGRTASYGVSIGQYDFFIIKIDASGNIAWSKTYGGAGNDSLIQAYETSDGGYILGGMSASFGSGSFDALVIKTDASGNITWSKTYGGAGYDNMMNIKETSDDGYILGGTTSSYGEGGYDSLAIKIDASGSIIWANVYGTSGTEYLYSIREITNGYIFGSRTDYYGAGNYDYLLIKTDSEGKVGCCSMVYDITSQLNSTSPTPSVTSPTPSVTSPTPSVTSPTPSVTSPTPTVTDIPST